MGGMTNVQAFPLPRCRRLAAGGRGRSLALVLTSMTSVQLGAALSTKLFGSLGVAGTTWLRLCCAAVMMLPVARPRIGRLALRDLAAAAALGVTTAAMTLAFFGAVSRLPLGDRKSVV